MRPHAGFIDEHKRAVNDINLPILQKNH